MTRKQDLFLAILGIELNQPFKIKDMPWGIYKFIFNDGIIVLMTKGEYDDDGIWDYSNLDWQNLLISEVIPC